MLKSLILSAAAAGLLAGLFTAALQHVTTTPIILAAERYEAEPGTTGPTHDHGSIGSVFVSTAQAHSPPFGAASGGASAWAPADGVERTIYTSVSTAVTGVGFALVLLGAMVLAGVRIGARTGLAFGVAGFAAAALAPALGLPPELPGGGAAALEARQIWWFCTAAATAAGLAALLLMRSMAAGVAGAVLIALPHLFGAPHPPEFVSTAPAELAGHFAAASLAVTGIFWAVLGALAGAFYQRIARAE